MQAGRSLAGRVAASTRTRQLVSGPRRSGRVLGVFPTAVYVAVDAERGADGGPQGGIELVAVETADGLGLPSAATLAAHSSTRPLHAIRAGDAAHVGEGSLDIGPLAFDVVRWWSPRRPRAVENETYDDARLTAVSQLLPSLSPELDGRLPALTSALTVAIDADVQDAVTALLGLGPGLTPEGDDVLAGVLVTLMARPATQPLAQRLGDIVASLAESRTTTLSAALLRDAADGFAVQALVDFVNALHEVDPHAGGSATRRALADVVVRLLAVGHTSGAALAHGAVATARLHVATLGRPEQP
jgi:Protein of unknown function (DUF2877)